MEDLIKTIKKKLSTDNIVEMMKDAKVLDNKRINEEDVRKTLEKIDPNNLIDVDELASKLNEITEEAAKEKAKAKKSEDGVLSVLSKKISGRGKSSKCDDDDDCDNAPGFLD